MSEGPKGLRDLSPLLDIRNYLSGLVDVPSQVRATKNSFGIFMGRLFDRDAIDASRTDDGKILIPPPPRRLEIQMIVRSGKGGKKFAGDHTLSCTFGLKKGDPLGLP